MKLWKSRNLTIEGRIVIFQPLAVSKFIRLALVTEIPTSITNLFYKTQIAFVWKDENPKIKHSTLCNEYENGRLKNVDDFSVVVDLQFSWIKRLFENSFYQRKEVPLYLVHRYLEKNHSNVEKNRSVLCDFYKFYQELLSRWDKYSISKNLTHFSPVLCFI